MQKQILVKLIAAVGLACVLGVGWALGLSSVQDIQQPSLEIPLYEGAQVEWEVHLTAQEMAKGLAEWVQELSVLRVAGYTIEGERVPEVLDFYDQTFSGWRRILWTQPNESGGVRLFARSPLSIVLSRVRAVLLSRVRAVLQQDPLLKGQPVQIGSFQVIGAGKASLLEKENYLFIAVSKRYEATDLIVVTAQVVSELEAPLFEGAELQWELVLTKHDLLEHLKRWFVGLMKNPPLAMRMRLWEQPERPKDRLIEAMSWLGILGMETLFRLLQDFSDVRIVGYQLDGNKALEVLSFYEQQFGNWTRNFWAKPEESGGIRIFSQGSAEGLKELVIVISQRSMKSTLHDITEPLEVTNVIILRARR